MNYDQDPPRWTSTPEEAPELLRGAFMAGRNEGPSRAQMQKLALKIAALSAGSAVAVGTAQAAAGGKVGASAASWSLSKLASVVIVAGGIATGAVVWNQSPQPAPHAAARRAPVAPSAVEEEALPVPQLEGAAETAEVVAGRPVVTSLSSAPSRFPEPEVVVVSAPTPRAEPAPAAPAANGSTRRTLAARSAQAAKKTARPAQRAQQTEAAPVIERESAGTGVAPTEIELLRRAQLALSARPREAYQLTEEHRQRFPNGAFALERDALAIQALIRAGDAAMARDLAESFLKAHPDSPHAHRFREAMGIH